MGDVRRVHRGRGERLGPNEKAVYRPSTFGNPFKIGPDGDRATVIEKHRAWLHGEGPDVVGRYDRRKVWATLPKLRGKDLACRCPDGEPCHGDTLLAIAKLAYPTPETSALTPRRSISRRDATRVTH